MTASRTQGRANRTTVSDGRQINWLATFLARIYAGDT
jgi:hypothetical protein